MNICMVSPSFYPAIVYGGPIFSSYYAALNLAKHDDINITVVTTNSNEGKPLNVQTNKKVKLDKGFYIFYFSQSLRELFPFNLIFGFLKQIKSSDVVHVQAIFNYTTVIAIIIATILCKPIMLSPRGCLGDWAMSHRKILKLFWIKLFISPISKKTLFHVTSTQEKHEVISMFGKVKTTIIPNGISPNEFEDIKTLSKSEFIEKYCSEPKHVFQGNQGLEKIIISMARLHPKKGLDILIGAFAEYLKVEPNSILAIAGPDEGFKNQLLDLAISMGINKSVFFVGMLEGQDRLEFLANADVFVLPSHNENFGNVYLESLLAGTPIIASKNTPWSLVEDYQCGRWEENSIQAITQSIIDVLEFDDNVRDRCKRLALGFTWPSIANSFVNEYKSLL